MASLQKNVASQHFTFPAVLQATGAVSTSTSTTIFNSLAFWAQDGSQAAAGGTFTFLGNGQWDYSPTQAETNATNVSLMVSPSGVIPVNVTIWTDPANFISLAISGAGAVTVGTNNDKTGYALTSGERNSISDALLDRDMSVGTDSGSSTVRTPRQAFRAIRNKVDTSSGTLTVYKEDDSTSSWTGSITGSSAAVPLVTVDPAGP